MTSAPNTEEPNTEEPSKTASELPVTAHKAEIIAAIQANQVVVICGETGSGKTTQIPKICLEMGRGRNGLIACTQPRRIATVTVAERVAQELGAKGVLVGWQHRFARHTSSENRIKFMTDGILLAEIRDNPLLRQYDTIMVDEAHERTLNIDFILGCLKQILPRRPDLKVIVSSATLETSRFSEFFNKAPVINIPGRTFPVDVRHREIDEDADLAQTIADGVDEVLAEPIPGDILVFLPGERDIRAAADILNARNMPYCSVIPLMASLPSAEQKRAFQTIRGVRRIILSTNVAETSVTIPGIRYVIDSGLARISRYNHRAHVKRLHIEPISQASAEQRKGRCGRIGPGVCIRLYAEDDLKKRPPYTEPEIRRTSLAGLILSMFDWRLGDLADFPFLQPPASSMIREGYKELLELNAIHENEAKPGAPPQPSRYSITPLGRRIVKLPLDPRLSRMLLAAEAEKSMRDALIVVSALSCEDPLVRPADKLDESAKAHAKFKTEKSDFAGILLLWRFFHDSAKPLSRSAMRRRCADNFMSYRKLCEWEDVREQLARQLKALHIDTDSVSDSDDGLHKALLSGLLSTIGLWDPEEKEYKGANGTRFSIFPGSGLYKKPPKWMMCAELVDTSRLYARRVAAIDSEWIEPLAQHVCKYNYHSEYWDPKFGTARALRVVTLYGLLISDGARCDISRLNPELSRMLFIRQGLLAGEFPKPVPPCVKQNLDYIGKHMATMHKTRSADPDADLELFVSLYETRLPKSCVNVPALRAWLAKATPSEADALLFKESDFETPPDVAAGFPDQISLAGRSMPLTYRHNLRGEDDGITCTVAIQDIPLLRLWHSDWLVPGALQDKAAFMLRLLTHAEIAQIAKALGGEIKARDVETIAERCIEKMEGHMPLATSLSRMLSRECRMTIDPGIWNEISMPDQFRIRWRIVNDKRAQVFVSRSKDEVFELFNELKKLAPELTKPSSTLSFGKEGFREILGMTQIDFPALPEEVAVGHAGSPIQAFPALHDDGNSVSARLFSTAEDARASHQAGILRLIMLSEKIAFDSTVRTVHAAPPKHRKPSIAHGGFNALPDALPTAPTPRNGSSLPPQPTLAKDIATGALVAVFVAESPTLPRSADALAGLIAARSSKFKEVLRNMSQLVGAILASAEDCFEALESAPNLSDESAADISEQLGWLVFTGFAGIVPLARLLEYPRYLHAIQVRIDRGNINPPKERQKMDIVRPRWLRHTSFAATLKTGIPYNPEALEEHRWLIEELRVSTWAQELRTPSPVSVQRLDRVWDTVPFAK